MKKQIFDKERISFNLLKYEKFGNKFEIIIDPDKAVEIIRNGDIKNIEEVTEMLKAQEIFKNSKTGARANQKDIIETFGTDDVIEVAIFMLENGEVQLNSEYRKIIAEQRYSQLIFELNKICTDAQTGYPIPVSRIENALKEGKFSINLYQKQEDQIKEALTCLSNQLNISYGTVEIEITVSSENIKLLKNAIPQIINEAKHNWLSDGFLQLKINLPKGKLNAVKNKINSINNKEIKIKIHN